MEQGFIRNESRGARRRSPTGWRIGAGLAGLALGLVACQDPNAGGAPTRHAKVHPGAHGETKVLPSIPPRPAGVSVAAVLEKSKEHFAPLPDTMPSPTNRPSEAKIKLGKMLYFDTRLSKNHDLACVTCHDLQGFGVDVREDGGARAKTSLGHRGQRGDRNSPSVYNAGLYLAQFWDGRAADLEAQAKGPVLNPVEMAMASEEAVVNTLASIPGYVEAFAAAFPQDIDPVTYDNMAQAIGAFERTLTTPGRFDAFLRGDLTALSEAELHGLDVFVDSGCIQCHTGPALGGTMFQKLGTVKPWEGLKDEGRFAVTKAEADKFVFKVPSLRNITQTGPYLHDGSIASLEEMVQKMAQHQLGKGELSPDELSAVVAFLGSLEGRLPEDRIAKPSLPPSGPSTPAPDPS